MRLTYLDESGTSGRERYAIVSGVMIDADKELIPIENKLDEIIQKHKLEENFGAGFIFHASAIWNGNDVFKGREDWPFPRRLPILQDLCNIAANFELPIPLGHFDKNEGIPYPDHENLDKAQLKIVHHALAFMQCLGGVEMTMRESFKDEITMLMVEDCKEVKKELENVQALLQDPKRLKAAGMMANGADVYLPLSHIREKAVFVKKADSKILQLADAHAFVIRGFLAKNSYGKDEMAQLYQGIREQFIFFPNQEKQAA